MAWKKIGEGLYQDTVTGAMGVLKKNKGGGLFVADKGKYTGKYKKDTTPSYKKDTEINKEINRNYNIASEYDKEAYELELKQRKEGRENGELTQKYRELEDLHKHKQNMAEDYRSYARKLENSRQRQTLNNEFGIGVKEKQLENLKTVGNVTQNTANLENTYIKHKNTRVEMNKVWRADASNELISKDLSAEIDYKTSNSKYSKMYGKEATKDVINRGQEALDRKSLSKDGYKNKEAQDFHFAGEELYSDDPNRFGDKMRKYNEKMNPTNPRETVNYYLKKGEFSKADQYMKDYGLEDERDAFLDGQNYKVQADYKEYQNAIQGIKEYAGLGYSQRQNKLMERFESSDTSPMSEYSDTTGTGISDRQHTALSKMSLSELRKTAQEYNIDTTGLSRQKLMAKLIAIFK